MAVEISSAKNKDGIQVHIDSVLNGKDCGCFCPVCQEPLIAKNNGKINKHHFSHFSDLECSYSSETALHLLAKQTISDSKLLRFPSVIINGALFTKSMLVEFDKVIVERKVDMFTPDLICIKNNKEIWVEIAVTHFTEPKKINYCRKNDITLFEIDLSKTKRNKRYGSLKFSMIHENSNRRFLCSRKIQDRKNKLFSIEVASQEKKDIWYIENRIESIHHLDKWLSKRILKSIFNLSVTITGSVKDLIKQKRYVLPDMTEREISNRANRSFSDWAEKNYNYMSKEEG